MAAIDFGLGADTWLILVFDQVLSAGLVRGESPAMFQVATQSFSAREPSDLTAFYDRLVDDRGSLVGIQVWPVGTSEKIVEELPHTSYLDRLGDGSFRCYFTEVLARNICSTGDQAFGGKFFLSKNGLIAMSVDISYLAVSDADLAAIRDGDVAVVTIENAHP